MKTLSYFFCILSLLITTTFSYADGSYTLRNWEDVNGRIIKASYISSDKTSVSLLIKGRRFTVRLSHFSEKDQAYVAGLTDGRNSNSAVAVARSESDKPSKASKPSSFNSEDEKTAGRAAAETPAEDVPPTEAEMRGAFQALVDSINKENKWKAEMAKNRTYDKNNPLSLFAALGGAIVGDGKITVVEFSKIGATKAVGKSGFVGEYVAKLGVEGSGNFARQMRPFLAQFSGGEIVQARFFRYRGSWIYKAENQ